MKFDERNNHSTIGTECQVSIFFISMQFRLEIFLDIIGIIDGTHIGIIAPSRVLERQYFNRKYYHSVNVQIVVDHEYRIINVDASWPGSAHDSFILRQSDVWRAFENNPPMLTGHILADSGYPNRRWLLTPYADPNTVQRRAYNRAHKRTRVAVEQTIGQWKRRFACLSTRLRVPIDKVAQIIGAAAVLHNLAKIIPDQPNEDEFEPIDDEQPFDEPYIGGAGINAYRDAYAANGRFH